MKKEMTLTDLKKKLSGMEYTELQKMICNMYKNSDMAEKMINMAILGSDYGEKLLKQYKEKIDNVFFPNDIVRDGFSLSWAKSLINEFKKICPNQENVLDLQLYFVECGTDFTNTFGGIDMKFYDSLCSAYHTVIQAVMKCEDSSLYQQFADRLYSVVKESEFIGWGYHDYVSEEFFSIPWREG